MSPKPQGTSQDEQAIRSLSTAFTTAWDNNDVKGLTALFTADGDLVNPTGRTARGGTEIEKLITDEHTGLFKETRMGLSLKNLRFLKPDVAVVDHEYAVTGLRGQPSALKGLVTLVLWKDADRWLISSLRAMLPVKMG